MEIIVKYFGFIAEETGKAEETMFLQNGMIEIPDIIAFIFNKYGLNEDDTNQGYNIGSTYYRDLAWGGLTESTYFELFNPKALARQRILDNIHIEQYGTNYNGNSISQRGDDGGCKKHFLHNSSPLHGIMRGQKSNVQFGLRWQV